MQTITIKIIYSGKSVMGDFFKVIVQRNGEDSDAESRFFAVKDSDSPAAAHWDAKDYAIELLQELNLLSNGGGKGVIQWAKRLKLKSGIAPMVERLRQCAWLRLGLNS